MYPENRFLLKKSLGWLNGILRKAQEQEGYLGPVNVPVSVNSYYGR